MKAEKLRIESGLLPMNLLSVALMVTVPLFPSSIVRIGLGIPFVLFFPGYALVSALFPRKEISNTERLALSLGMSIAVVPLIGLILNYTPLGVRLESLLYSLGAFIFFTSAVGWFRRERLVRMDRFSVGCELRVLGWDGNARNKFLSLLMIIAVLGALGAVGYAIAVPKTGEPFTEFYISLPDDKTVGFPGEITIGETGTVTLGIVNRERKATSYRIEIKVAGVKNNEVTSITLGSEERWESKVNFLPENAGHQKVECFLFKDGEAESSMQPLHFWVSVVP